MVMNLKYFFPDFALFLKIITFKINLTWITSVVQKSLFHKCLFDDDIYKYIFPNPS